MGLKEKIRELKEGLLFIPPVFWRNHGRNKDLDNLTLWLLRDTEQTRWGFRTVEIFGIKRSGNIIYKVDKGFEVRRFETFFANPGIEFSKSDESLILETINSFLFFKKQNQKILTARDIISCSNLEVRRELMRDFKYENLVKELRGIVINTDKTGELIKLQVRKEESMKFVKVKDASTDREYIIRVPPNMKTCKEAVAWTFGLGEKEYNPERET